MNDNRTGKMIKELRKKAQLTQRDLADRVGVSYKTISKWETGKGLPDISLIDPLSKTLKVCINELILGEYRTNHNMGSNMLKSKFAVCPACGNIIHTMGENNLSCCGIHLPILEAKPENEQHSIHYQLMENEIFISIDHFMTKEHYISFIAYITNDRCELQKLYPEQNAETRFFIEGKEYYMLIATKMV